MSVSAVHERGPKNGQFQPVANKASGLLQRKCSSCGNHTVAGGECNECSKRKRLPLQTKLAVSEPGDIYEQEADRIADQVLAAPLHSRVSYTPPRIQRFTSQSTGQTEAVPESVDRVLASSGSPLEPGLRQDMEQRFGYDFSAVRVHYGTDAQQSTQELNANAYTIGRNIAFGAGRFAPATHQGRRLIAHELAHVVQQSSPFGVTTSRLNASSTFHNGCERVQRQSTEDRTRTSRHDRAARLHLTIRGTQRSFTRFQRQHPDLAREMQQIDPQTFSIVEAYRNAVLQHGISGSDEAESIFVNAVRRWMEYTGATIREDSINAETLSGWISLVNNVLISLKPLLRLLTRRDIAESLEFSRRILLRQVQRFASHPFISEGRESRERRRRERQASTSEAPRVSQSVEPGETEQAAHVPVESEREVYSHLTSSLRDYVERHRVEEHQGVHLGPIVQILVRSLGQDQQRLAHFFGYLQQSDPDLLRRVLLRGRTARAFTGERPILPSLGRVLAGIFVGDVRDIFTPENTSVGVQSPEEPLGRFGAGTEAEESSLEEAGILGGAIGVGLIPIVGQLADVRDMGANLYIVYTRPTERGRWERWLALVSSALGAIPAVGDALKYASRWLLNTRIGGAIASSASDFLAPLRHALGGRISRVRAFVEEFWQSRVVAPTMDFWNRIQSVAERIAQRLLGVPPSIIAAVRSAGQRMFPTLLLRIRTAVGDLIRLSAEPAQAIAAATRRSMGELSLQFRRFRSLVRRITPTGRMIEAISGAEEAQATARRLLDNGEVEAAQEALARADGLAREALRGAEDILQGTPSAVGTAGEVLVSGLTADDGAEGTTLVRAEAQTSVSPARSHDAGAPVREARRRPTTMGEAVSTAPGTRRGQVTAGADEVPARADQAGITSRTRATRPVDAPSRSSQLQVDEAGNLSRSTRDGEHTLTLTRSGRLVRCSRCEDLFVRYEDVLRQDSRLRAQLEDLQERARTAVSTGAQEEIEEIMAEVAEFEEMVKWVEEMFGTVETRFQDVQRPRITGTSRLARSSRPRVENRRIPNWVVRDREWLNQARASGLSDEEIRQTPWWIGMDPERSHPPRRLLDVEDVRRPNEAREATVSRVGQLLGRRIDEITGLEEAWKAARDHVLNGRAISEISRDEMLGLGPFENRGLYARAQQHFWRNVREDNTAKEWLNSLGFELRADSSGAAHISLTSTGSLTDESGQALSDIDTRVTLGHIQEKAQGENWRQALDAHNLRFELHHANTDQEIRQMRHPELRK